MVFMPAICLGLLADALVITRRALIRNSLDTHTQPHFLRPVSKARAASGSDIAQRKCPEHELWTLLRIPSDPELSQLRLVSRSPGKTAAAFLPLSTASTFSLFDLQPEFDHAADHFSMQLPTRRRLKKRLDTLQFQHSKEFSVCFKVSFEGRSHPLDVVQDPDPLN